MIDLFVDKTSGRNTYYFFDDDGSVIDLPTRWLASLRNKLAIQSLDHYSSVLVNSMRWMRLLGYGPDLPMDIIFRLINRAQIEDLLFNSVNLFTGAPLSEMTRRNRELILKDLLTFATTEAAGRVRSGDSHPWSTGRLITPGPVAGLPKALTERQFIALLNGYHNECERVLIHAAWDIGWRVSEAARSRAGHLPNTKDYPAGAQYYEIHVMGAKGFKGQIRERHSLISAPVYKRIKRYHANDDVYFENTYGMGDDAPLFLTANGLPLLYDDGSVKDDLISKQMSAAADRANLDSEFIHFHVMRHSNIVNILASDHFTGPDADARNAALAKENAGHSRFESMKPYARMNLAQMAGGQRINRFEQAQRIVAATTNLEHKERRGHRHA